MHTHKTGDTWRTLGQANIQDLSTGAPANLTGWAIASQLRDSVTGALIQTFDCQLVDPVAQTFTHAAASTAHWPPGLAALDVQFTDPQGQTVSTDTQVIRVLPDVTRLV